MIPIRGKLNAEEAAGITAEQTDSESVSAPAVWRSSPNRNAASGGKAGSVVQKAAIHVELNDDIRNQLDTLAAQRFGNIFLSDSQNQINKLRQLALISGEPPLCHLTLTLLTATDNPKQLTSVKSVLDGQYKLGIVDPAIDGLGEASWNIVTKIISEKITSDDGSGQDTVPENLRQFSRQYELLEALESGEIDAALVWNTASVTEFLLAKYADEFNQKFAPLLDEVKESRNREHIRTVLKSIYDELMGEKIFGEEVSIVNNPNERCVISVPIIVLTTSETMGYSRRFADFLISNEGKAVLRKFGFSP